MDSELTLYHSDSNSMVVYHSEDGAVQLAVQLSDETVCRKCRKTKEVTNKP